MADYKTFDTVDIEAKIIQGTESLYKDTVNITKITATAQLVYVSISTTVVLLVLSILIAKLSFDAAK